MQHAVIHLQGTTVRLPAAEEGTATTEEVPKDPAKPGPILPEMKELAWGAGSFVVFALLMRFVLFPKLRKGMQARYDGIRSDHESADAERSAARAEVAAYEAELVAVKAQATGKIDAARNSVEAERSGAIATLNARLGEQRAAAQAQAEAARAAAQDQIQAAVSDVAGRAGELATGRRPSADVVNRVVSEVMAK